jgi:hypothetical protein
MLITVLLIFNNPVARMVSQSIVAILVIDYADVVLDYVYTVHKKFAAWYLSEPFRTYFEYCIYALFTVRNGHARKFSAEPIHIILVKIQKIINFS